MRRRRLRSASAAVEGLTDTCGTGAAPTFPAAFGSASRSSRVSAGFGLSSNRSGIRLCYSHRTKIPNMILFAGPQMVNSPQSAQPPRILALDFGSKNIGLAVSDELGLTAQGLPTLRRSNKRNDLDHLRRVIRQYGVSEMVMGLPLRMSGGEGI